MPLSVADIMLSKGHLFHPYRFEYTPKKKPGFLERLVTGIAHAMICVFTLGIATGFYYSKAKRKWRQLLPSQAPKVPNPYQKPTQATPQVPTPPQKQNEGIESPFAPPVGKHKGIQGENNTCAFASLLFTLFSTSRAMDGILREDERSSSEAKALRTILKEIVSKLRQGYVPSKDMTRFRQLLFNDIKEGTHSPHRSPEEILNRMLTILKAEEGVSVIAVEPAGQTFKMDDLIQDFIAKNGDAELKKCKVLLVDIASRQQDFKLFDTIDPTLSYRNGRLVGASFIGRAHVCSLVYDAKGQGYFFDSMAGQEQNPDVPAEYEDQEAIPGFEVLPPCLKQHCLHNVSEVRKATQSDEGRMRKDLTLCFYEFGF